MCLITKDKREKKKLSQYIIGFEEKSKNGILTKQEFYKLTQFNWVRDPNYAKKYLKKKYLQKLDRHLQAWLSNKEVKKRGIAPLLVNQDITNLELLSTISRDAKVSDMKKVFGFQTIGETSQFLLAIPPPSETLHSQEHHTNLVKVYVNIHKVATLNEKKRHFWMDLTIKYEMRYYDSDVAIINNAHDVKLVHDSNTVWRIDASTYRRVQRFRGTFYEHLELHSFPFDTQPLTISIRANGPLGKDKFSGTQLQCVELGILKFKLPGWYIVPVLIAAPVRTDSRYDPNKNVYHQLNIMVVLVRSCSFYIYNLILIIFMILSTVWINYGYDQSDLSSRMDVNFSIMLAHISFRFSINAIQPNVPYLTWLDKYAYISFMFLIINIGCDVCVYTIDDPEVAVAWDFIRMVVFTGTWLLFHFSVAIYSIFKLTYGRRIKRSISKYHKSKMHLDHKIVTKEGVDYSSGSTKAIQEHIKTFLTNVKEYEV